ncbi:hypothetical protein GYA37_04215 [candidate division WWE3 bacterium]|uniref:Uncharacterized protein n=1 Tax=candidate division WWE3 bacterium TaxID=2053526 RepID=A0A7X9E7L9_UNCKA|nr:hypothetical protein [candidate division WWE3 bacterium]
MSLNKRWLNEVVAAGIEEAAPQIASRIINRDDVDTKEHDHKVIDLLEQIKIFYIMYPFVDEIESLMLQLRKLGMVVEGPYLNSPNESNELLPCNLSRKASNIPFFLKELPHDLEDLWIGYVVSGFWWSIRTKEASEGMYKLMIIAEQPNTDEEEYTPLYILWRKDIKDFKPKTDLDNILKTLAGLCKNQLFDLIMGSRL